MRHTGSHFYDDAHIYVNYNPGEVDVAVDRLNIDLVLIVEDCRHHEFTSNPVKSSVILFGGAAVRRELSTNVIILVGGTTLKISDTIKNLVIYIDSELSFRDHVSSCLRMVMCMVRI